MKTVMMVINCGLFAVCGYLLGENINQDTQKVVDNQVAINYAVYKALEEGNN